MTSLDRNYQEVTNLSFVLSGLRLNIFKTEKMLPFWDKNRGGVGYAPVQRDFAGRGLCLNLPGKLPPSSSRA